MLLLLQAAEEAAEPSKTPFYILASCLVAFALILAAVGTARHETFPPTRGAQRAIMLVGALLVAGTMFTAVITA
jgi:hypothetical protein